MLQVQGVFADPYNWALTEVLGGFGRDTILVPSPQMPKASSTALARGRAG